MMTKVKTPAELEAMRESGRMLATVLGKLKDSVQPGMSTADLSAIAKAELKRLGGQPTFLGYYGFPDVLCVSLNDEVVHGIPSPQRIIQDGDIVSMDFGVTYKGMVTDSAISVIAGTAAPEDAALVKATEQSMYAGIEQLKNGVKTGDIGQAIEDVLNQKRLGIVRDFVGHGVGHQLHEDPNVPNYGPKGVGSVLKAGMTIAIEPMATRGAEEVYVADDGWTVRTQDGSRSAHFEHTILITDNGYDILTSPIALP